MTHSRRPLRAPAEPERNVQAILDAAEDLLERRAQASFSAVAAQAAQPDLKAR
jgi:hypothetical protein